MLKTHIKSLYISFLLFSLLNFSSLGSAIAAVISPSAMEVDFKYTATYLSNTSPEELQSQDALASDAEFHAKHLFGILQSAELTAKYGIDFDLISGLGSPRMPLEITIKNTAPVGERLEITYNVKGRMLVHKKAGKKWLKDTKVTLPLLYDLPSVYDQAQYSEKWRNCTDEHYWTEVDFWYFYDPFREDCTALSKTPLAKKVDISVEPVITNEEWLSSRNMPLDEIRGDNGNGDLFTIYVIHGFAESFKDPKDDNRVLFKKLQKELEKLGFETKVDRESSDRVLQTYTKKIGSMNVRIRHLLAETGFDGERKTFATFWKEAVEEGDVILYGGHSGSGGNLSLDNLNWVLSKSDGSEINFNNEKRQIIFLDSCSSYAYYLEPYRTEKARARITMITYGLPSYFANAGTVLSVLLNTVLDPSSNPKWIDLLTEMEEALDGASSLINAGPM